MGGPRTPKSELITWAKAGKPKPSRYVGGYKANVRLWKLANTLYGYTNPKQAHYDPELDTLLRELRPDWFELPSIRKARLEREWVIEDAHLGFPKPANLMFLCRTHELLEKELRAIRPDWFVDPREERSRLYRIRRKKEVLWKARNGLNFSGPERQFHYLSRQPDRLEYDPVFCQVMEKYGTKGVH